MDELNKTTYQYDENKLFTAYKEASGNVHRAYLTYKDQEGFPSSKDTWYVYEVEFNWEKRLEELQEKIRKETDENLIVRDKEILQATSLIIKKFFSKIKRMSEVEEDKLTINDFKIAWEIYRITLGKPTQTEKGNSRGGSGGLPSVLFDPLLTDEQRSLVQEKIRFYNNSEAKTKDIIDQLELDGFI